MKDVQFVNANQLETLEQYGAAMVSSMVSLRTLESFHLAAYEKGILKDDEVEASKTICWELRRLMSLYKTQIQNVLDRTSIDEAMIIESLRKMMPDVKIPRKKRASKDKIEDK